MVKKILNAASWLSLVQGMNMLCVILLSILVIRRIDAEQVSAYMYAVFVTDAVMSYTLLQIGLRITLAKDDTTFRRLFKYSRRFSVGNALVAVVAAGIVVLVSDNTGHPQALYYVAWLTAAGIANYFAQICFSVCDYTFDYKSFGVSSAVSNIASLVIAIAVFALGGGIFSMVIRDVARGFILLALALKSMRSLVPQLDGVAPLDGKSKLAFLGFLIKRHSLKVIEVSNHRVPALVTSAGNLTSLGHFGVAFQLLSQIMGVLTIIGDKLAYSFFARAEQESKLRYLSAVVAIYAIAGLVIFIFGERLFAVVYGQQWRESSKVFSYLGLYLFTHGSLGVITNYLITEQRFPGVYLAWGGWTLTFVACYLYDRTWQIVGYYLAASAVAFVLAICALLLARHSSRSGGVPRTPRHLPNG
jgi:O-antigen/teichoic acid export membrane protein